jgi:hypothetical protein
VKIYSLMDDIDDHWDWVRPELEKCQEYDVNPIDMISIREDIRSRKGCVLVIEDDTGLLSVSLIDFHEKSLHVRLCSGHRMDEWITPLIDTLDQMAKVLNKKYVTQLGRVGWAKVMKGHGWKHQLSQYVRTV